MKFVLCEILHIFKTDFILFLLQHVIQYCRGFLSGSNSTSSPPRFNPRLEHFLLLPLPTPSLPAECTVNGHVLYFISTRESVSPTSSFYRPHAKVQVIPSARFGSAFLPSSLDSLESHNIEKQRAIFSE